MEEIIFTDALEGIRGLESESVDCLLTDPPYDSLKPHMKMGTKTRLKKRWFKVPPREYLVEVFQECWRVLKKDRHALIFCDCPTSDWTKPLFLELGARRCRRLVWDKMTIGMGYGFRRRYEFILWAEKGKAWFREKMIGDVFQWPRVRDGRPVRKPPQLIEKLLHQVTHTGWTVLDPFAGSGSTVEAANNLGRKVIAFEIDPRKVHGPLEKFDDLEAFA